MNGIHFLWGGRVITLSLEHITKTEFFPAHSFQAMNDATVEVPAELHVTYVTPTGGGINEVNLTPDMDKFTGLTAEKIQAWLRAETVNLDSWWETWKDNLPE